MFGLPVMFVLTILNALNNAYTPFRTRAFWLSFTCYLPSKFLKSLTELAMIWQRIVPNGRDMGNANVEEPNLSISVPTLVDIVREKKFLISICMSSTTNYSSTVEQK